MVVKNTQDCESEIFGLTTRNSKHGAFIRTGKKNDMGKMESCRVYVAIILVYLYIYWTFKYPFTDFSRAMSLVSDVGVLYI